jgi:hypothetical protein
LLNDLKQFLKQLRPGAAIHVLTGSVEEDFAAFWKAPYLIKNGQSTFSLWAALAGYGQTYAIPMAAEFAVNTTPALGPGWNWRTCPLLEPAIGKTQNISTVQSMIKWLRAN